MFLWHELLIHLLSLAIFVYSPKHSHYSHLAFGNC